MLRILCIACGLGLVACGTAPDASIAGEVMSVRDGDTLELLVDARAVRVRLAEIDAPEIGQPWGRRAKDRLVELAFRKVARVEIRGADGYGRLLGHVYVGNLHVNRQLVREGHAWAYRQYLEDEALLELESQARAQGVGLWQFAAGAVPPWDWRRGERASAAASPLPEACRGKRFCSEMESCEEAEFFLATCRMSQLDRDGDGVPCESLCGG